MTRLVLDAALTAHWCFETQEDYAQAVLAVLAEGEALVGPDWSLEVAALLGRAVALTLIAEEDARAFLILLEGLPIRSRPVPLTPAQGFELLTGQGLSPAQGACLELARREALPLATLDPQLRRAAERLGVALFRP